MSKEKSDVIAARFPWEIEERQGMLDNALDGMEKIRLLLNLPEPHPLLELGKETRVLEVAQDEEETQKTRAVS